METNAFAQEVRKNRTPGATNNSPVTNNSQRDVVTINVGDVSFDMIRVEPGNFVMGCTEEQGDDCYGDETPYHRVIMSESYYIGKFEVTQELFEAVMGYNPSNWKAYDRPVENVTWNEAKDFCTRLSRMTGRSFTLPTEAEWEYAARGGHKATTTKYSGSANINTVAWYDGNSDERTHPVGRLSPNELGIYDMSGNVYEWCLDYYGEYSSVTQRDPQGLSSGTQRVYRGGSWHFTYRGCRVAYRNGGDPDNRDSQGGFRIVFH
ncbi:MAG: formylglycine-generating enzyme family protein [Bacteroidales bacterium]|nr:formylglycine-generating enzyme family protein [Bacteroidales bacterium]